MQATRGVPGALRCYRVRLIRWPHYWKAVGAPGHSTFLLARDPGGVVWLGNRSIRLIILRWELWEALRPNEISKQNFLQAFVRSIHSTELARF